MGAEINYNFNALCEDLINALCEDLNSYLLIL